MASPTRIVLVLALAFGTACQPYHLPGGGADDGPQIGEHGISVPVPPPSLTAAPKQSVDVDGDLGDMTPEPQTQVFLLEVTSGAGYFAFAASDGTFHIPDVEIDLFDNCLEVWSEEPGAYGEMSMHSFFRASIAQDDQSIVTDQFFSGC